MSTVINRTTMPLLAVLLVASQDGHGVEPDPRRALSEQVNKPSWHGSVLKLKVPLQRYISGRKQHHIEACTATVAALNPLRLVTAWHCFDGAMDLTRPPQVLWDSRWLEVKLLASGGSMAEDWAVLEVRDDSVELPALPINVSALQREDAVLLAGYSGDRGLGREGEELTWDPHCRVVSSTPVQVATNCIAHKGASGGPVITLTDGPSLRAVLSGRVSSGERLAIPVSLFARFLR